MSRSFSLNYELEKKRRQDAYENQVRSTTQSFLERHESVLRDLQSQDLVSFVKNEFQKAEQKLTEAQALLSDDPEGARRVSSELGTQIWELTNLARSRQREQIHQKQIAERQQREEARLRELEEARLKAEKEENLRAEMRTFLALVRNQPRNILKDPVALDAVWKELMQLQNRFSSRVFGDEAEIIQAQREFETELTVLVSDAERKAAKWREKKAIEEKKEQISEQISESLEVIQMKTNAGTETELMAVSEKLAKLKTDFLAGLVTESEARTRIHEARQETVDACTNEELRRETLKAIIKTLREAGFILEGAPQLQDDGFVRLPAVRPTGEKCLFLVAANGSMKYSFHGYSGSACKNDIEKVMPKLEEIYGIHFSDERLLWENPDRLEKDAKELPGDGSFKKQF